MADLKAMLEALDKIEVWWNDSDTLRETQTLREGIEAMAVELEAITGEWDVSNDADGWKAARYFRQKACDANAKLEQAKEDTLKRVLSVMDKTATLLNDRDFANNPYRRAITDELAAIDAASQGGGGTDAHLP